jgi:hypothetical protein
MNSQIPEGCYPKTKLARALKIGTSRMQELALDDDFPEPAGYYCSGSMSKRRLPYWRIAVVQDWLAGNDVEVRPARNTDKPYQSADSQPGWAIPAHDQAEAMVSLNTREFLHLMRVGL